MTDAGDQIVRQILDQTDTRAFWREVQVVRRSRTNGGGIDAEIEHVGYERRRHSGEIDALDAPGNLRLGGLAEFQLVEDVAGDPVVIVRIPQTIDRASWIVRARRGQFLMTGLQAERCGDRRKAGIERHHLHFEATFLLLVGERLPDAERRWILGICEANLVVPIVGSACPEPDGIDRCRVWPIFALGSDFGLIRVDAGLVMTPST